MHVGPRPDELSPVTHLIELRFVMFVIVHPHELRGDVRKHGPVQSRKEGPRGHPFNESSINC